MKLRKKSGHHDLRSTSRAGHVGRRNPTEGHGTRSLAVATAALAAMALVFVFGACGGSSSRQVATNQLLGECETYLSAYRACATRTGASAGMLGEREAQLRAAFETQAAGGETAREETRTRCRNTSQRLEESCR
jgi:hypothetical protein